MHVKQTDVLLVVVYYKLANITYKFRGKSKASTCVQVVAHTTLLIHQTSSHTDRNSMIIIGIFMYKNLYDLVTFTCTL